MVKEKAKEEVRGRQSGEWEEGKVGMTIKEEKGKIIQPRTCGEQEMERNACERVMLLPAVCHPSFLAADFSGDGGVGAWGGARHVQPGVSLSSWASGYRLRIATSPSPSRLLCLMRKLILFFVCLFVQQKYIYLSSSVASPGG